jgi:hypothetical protein
MVPFYKTLLILLGKARPELHISDFQEVDITVGGLSAFTSLITAAKARGLKVPQPPPRGFADQDPKKIFIDQQYCTFLTIFCRLPGK